MVERLKKAAVKASGRSLLASAEEEEEEEEVVVVVEDEDEEGEEGVPADVTEVIRGLGLGKKEAAALQKAAKWCKTHGPSCLKDISEDQEFIDGFLKELNLLVIPAKRLREKLEGAKDGRTRSQAKQQGPSMAARAKKALVVGIGDYRDHEGRPSDTLGAAVPDARAMQTALTGIGFQCELVINCTFSELWRATRRFVSSLNEGDVGFFYFAGHGGMDPLILEPLHVSLSAW